MKKIKGIIIALIMMFGFTGIVNGAAIDLGECMAFADAFHTISVSEGQYYYRYCWQASCTKNQFVLANRVIQAGYRCANGNGTPYRKMVKDGCSSYRGSCNSSTFKNNPYCNTTDLIDCTKLANGQPYTGNTTTTKKIVPTTQAPQQQTQAPKTTKATAKKTTKKAGATTKRTNITIPVTTTTTTTTVARKSSNTNIKKLFMNGTEQKKYNNRKTTYPLPLAPEVDEITVECELEDPNASYYVEGNTGLTEDGKVIKIVVTAEDGTEKTVEFVVSHSAEDASDCSLAQIFIEKYPIDFASNNYVYNLKLPKNVNSLDMEVIPTDSLNAKYSIENNEKLKHKSVVNVLVVAQDGTECNYEIHISKDNNTWKLILVIVLIGAGLIVAGYFLFRYLKKSKGKYKYE